MKISTTWYLLVLVGLTWRETIGTCVLESDFGFSLNCAFKKSGLFRVRNLGGVKGYVGLGFSVGDELGFRESLSNLESSKRRSVQTRGNSISVGTTSNGGTLKREDRERGSQSGRQSSGPLPPFKPLPPGVSRPMGQQPARQRLVVQQNLTALRTIPAPSFETLQQHEAAIRKQQVQLQNQRMQNSQMPQPERQLQAQRNVMAAAQQAKDQQELLSRQQQKNQQDIFALQVLKQQRQQQQEATRQQQMKKLAERQNNAQQQVIALQTKRIQVPQSSNPIGQSPVYSHTIPNTVSSNFDSLAQRQKPAPANLGLPAFIAMPVSSSQLTDRISHRPVALEDSLNEVSKDEYAPLAIPNEEAAASVNEMTLQSFNPAGSPEALNLIRQNENDKKQSMSNLPSLAPIQGMETSLKVLAEASNITLEALEAAILLRQKQLMEKQHEKLTTSTTTTMQTPIKNYNNAGITKVMNAPREYYPNGYDKNFDDNFSSRVDLPDTSFYCGDQKHFPGLYADEDLGCMVFHVCALTDEGLIMKSFLCPESTLFDQTILKCNWWFYVDCKSSKSLYDSNIPISKSYQLMKALAFFSAYKNHDNATAPADDNIADS